MAYNSPMQQYATLEWSITTTQEDTRCLDGHANEYVRPTLCAKVVPVVNGTPMTTPWVFDPLTLFDRQLQGYYLFDMFTCDCGVAGCAGIHDHVHLRVNQDTVQWQFPREEPFLSKFIPAHFADNTSPMVMTFGAQEYHIALQSLRQQLVDLENNNPGVPVTLWPDDGQLQRKPLSSVDVLIQESNDWFLQREERIRDDKAYWGPLYRAELHIPMEETAYTIGIHSFLDAVCDKVLGQDDTDEPEIDDLRADWMTEQIGYYRDHPIELLTLFKSMPWECMQDYGYIAHANQTALATWIGTQWPNIPVVFVPEVLPEQIDWTLL